MKYLSLLFILSLISITWINFINIKIIEINNGYKLEKIIENICEGYVISYIFYIICIYYPEKNDRKFILPWISKKIEFIINGNNNLVEEILSSNNINNSNLIKLEYPNGASWKNYLKNINPKGKTNQKKMQLLIGGIKYNNVTKQSEIWSFYLMRNKENTNERINDLLSNSKYIDGNLLRILLEMKDSLFLKDNWGFNSNSFNKMDLSEFSLVFENYFKLIKNLSIYYNKIK